MQMAKWFILSAAVAVLAGVPALRAEDAEAVNYRPFSIGVDASTLGAGVSANWRFHDHFGAHAGIQFFGYSKDADKIEGIAYDTDLRLLTEPLALDYYPWSGNPFRISAGILLNQTRLKGDVPQDPIAGRTLLNIGANLYDSSAIGNLNLKVESKAISPFISVGTSVYLDQAKRWSISGELGIAYTGTPDVTLGNSGAPIAAPDLALEIQQIKDGVWKVYPIVKLGVGFSF
ncbi:MAG TPA: hypothetical protein PKO21_01440 [Verrucomicrobiota bacterium]|nr:hypothetical protein [Verrucomicrobiota bacterium]